MDYGNNWSADDYAGRLHLPHLAPGKYTVRCEIDSALVAVDDMVGLAADAGVDEWPPAKRRWQRTCEAELTVYPKDAQLVSLSDDPALNPVNSAKLGVKPIIIRPRDGELVAVVSFETHARTKGFPFSVKATLKLAGKSYPDGSFRHDEAGRASYTSNPGLDGPGALVKIGDLDPQVTEAEVLLEPDPQFVESSPGVNRIWGSDITLKHIPLKRLDLE